MSPAGRSYGSGRPVKTSEVFRLLVLNVASQQVEVRAGRHPADGDIGQSVVVVVFA